MGQDFIENVMSLECRFLSI